MITIKCFGNVEIEGDEYLPEGVKIISTGSVQFSAGVVNGNSKLTCFAAIKENEWKGEKE